MRPRPVHVSFLKESRDALPYRHCSFHMINRATGGLHIEILYSSRANRIWPIAGIAPESPTPGYKIRRRLLLEICGTPGSALQRKHCAAAICGAAVASEFAF